MSHQCSCCHRTNIIRIVVAEPLLLSSNGEHILPLKTWLLFAVINKYIARTISLFHRSKTQKAIVFARR